MSATASRTAVTSAAEIDLEIAVASVALSGAREGYTRCPSAENARLLDAATAEIDRLLDERLAARR